MEFVDVPELPYDRLMLPSATGAIPAFAAPGGKCARRVICGCGARLEPAACARKVCDIAEFHNDIYQAPETEPAEACEACGRSAIAAGLSDRGGPAAGAVPLAAKGSRVMREDTGIP